MTPRPPPALVALALALACAGPASAGFTDRTAPAGLTKLGTSWGAAFADLDGDGTLDLYAGHHTAPPTLYWNVGGTFDPNLYVPQPWSGDVDRHGAVFAPLDDDESIDMFILHGAGNGPESNELYRNDPGPMFVSLDGAGGMEEAILRGRCASVADFDGDRRLDVWIGCAPKPGSPNKLFRSRGAMDFVDVTDAAGLGEEIGTVGGLWGDFDDDGDPDLLVGGEEFVRPTVLWRNDGGSFVDVSDVFSPPLPIVSGADWGDADGDGDLDLAVCDGAIGVFDTWSEGAQVSYFFNTGYGDTGVDGLTVPCSEDTVWATFRLRGIPDPRVIYLGPSKVNPSPVLTITLHDGYVGEPELTPGVDRGTFVWRASPGGPWEIRCITPNVDYDNFDGWLTGQAPISGVTASDLEDPGYHAGGPHVWRNDGGSFVEITAQLGLPAQMENPRDISWVDFDNDGDLDLHVVDKGTSAFPNAPDALFRNDGAAFVDVAGPEGVSGSVPGNGMGDGGVWGDTDGDGDLDLFLLEGAGPATFSRFGPCLFLRNDGSRGASIQLDLVGDPPYASAVGAKVTAVAGTLRVTRRVSANSWRGFEDPLRVHLGLGTAAVCDSLTVEWPDGVVQHYPNMAPGMYRIEEGVVGAPEPFAAGSAPADWSVGGPSPQPARGAQRFELAAPRGVRLDATVHDVSGRLVRVLHRGSVPAGSATVTWDGRDARGRRVGAGVYFLRVTDGASTLSRKCVRLR